jgi:hypothetical protein
MNEDAERRIEEARQKAEREREAKEFLESLKVGDEIVKPIHNPEAYALRSQAVGRANRGELKRTDCQHKQAYLNQYIDEDPGVKRSGRPINLYECGICHTLLWLVDPWGRVAGDG